MMTGVTSPVWGTWAMPKADFKFRTELRVRWMECDAQGIVFNGAYLGYLEVAQAEYYRNLGISIYHLPRSGYFDLAVVKTTIEFKAPALVDEIVEAYVRVSRFGNTSMDMQLELYRPEPEKLLTSIDAVYVGYDAATGGTRRVPDQFRELICHYEASGEILSLSHFPDLNNAMQIANGSNHSS